MTPSEWVYVLDSSLWSLLGLVAGFFLGSGYKMRRHREKLGNIFNSRVLGWMIVALAAASVLVGLRVHFEKEQQDICQAQYNQEVARVLIQRDRVAQREQQNLAELVRGVAQTDNDAKQRAALEDFIADSRELERQRANLDLPTPPTQGGCNGTT